MLTKKGIEMLLKRAVDDSVSPFIFLSIGSGEKQVSDQDVQMDKEYIKNGMQRILAEIRIDEETGHLFLKGVWTALEKLTITEIGCWNEMVGGTLLARDLIGPITTGVGMQLDLGMEISLEAKPV